MKFNSYCKTEKGTIYKKGALSIALCYPSDYSVGMSSLGFQTIYRLFNSYPGVSCERIFYTNTKDEPRSIETDKKLSQFHIIAFSIATELELGNFAGMLKLSKIPALRSKRNSSHPLVICGGPLTLVDPMILSELADIIFVGESEEILPQFVNLIFKASDKVELEESLKDKPNLYIPSIHDEPEKPQCVSIENLPAFSQIITPKSEFSSMFLVEVSRGCSRKCHFCIMSQKTKNKTKLRFVEPDKILSSIPSYANKVGLVGAAVSDYPWLCDLLKTFIEKKITVGVSSLRADMLDEEKLSLLKKANYKTITISADAFSQRLRDKIEKGITEKHLINVAEIAKKEKFSKLKLYMMIGYPDETQQDIEEGIELIKKIAGFLPLTVVISPLVPKPRTALSDASFAEIKYLKNVFGNITKSTSNINFSLWPPKWAWIEYKIANSGKHSGIIALNAWERGLNFEAWKQSIQSLIIN